MAVRAYRIMKPEYAPLDGSGASVYGGRWNSPGREVVYCGGSYAGALLEILVHANLRRLPRRYVCAVIEIPDGTAVESLEAEDLPGWDSPDLLASRRFGDRWLEEGRTVALIVPSVVGQPFERNVVVNPDHVAAKRLSVEDPIDVQWDARLFATR